MTNAREISRAASVAAVTMALLAGILFAPAACADADKASRYYEDAVVKFDHGDLAAATIQLKNALKQDPSLLPAHILLGRAYLQQGLGLEAEQEIKEASRRGADRSVTVPLLAEAYLLQFKHKQLLSELDLDGLSDSARVDLLITRGQALIDLGDNDKAMAAFKEAATLDQKSARPIVGEALTALRSGDIKTAAQAADAAVALDAGSADAWNAEASVHHARGELEQAVTMYGRAIALDPKNREARIGRVAALFDLGRVSETGEDLKYLALNYPSDPRAAYLRAVKFAKEGDLHGARMELAEATGILDGLSSNWLDNNAQLLLLAGTVNYSLGQFEKAREYLQRYVAKFPAGVGVQKMLGSALLALHETDVAVNVLTAAQSSAPKDPVVLTLLADAWMAKGQYEQASTLLQQAASLPGADATVRTQLAVNQLFRGYADQALTGLSSVFKDDPSDTRAGLLLAVVQQRRGDFRDAASLATKLLEKDPKNLTLMNLRASAQAGMGDRVAARATFGQVLKLDPHFLPAQFNLARLDLLDGKPDAARARLKATLKDRPADSRVLMELAHVEEDTGNPLEAIRWLEQGRTVDNRSIELRLHLAELLLQQKLYDRAKAVVWEAQSRAPDNLDVLDLLARVQIAEGNSDMARATLKRMSDTAAFDGPWLLKIASRQMAVEAWNDARYSLVKAIEGSPDYLPARVAAADLALARGNLDEAGDQIKQVAERWPAAAVTERLKGDLAMKGGKPADALEHYRASLDREASTAVIVRLAAASTAAGKPADAVKSLSDWLTKYPKDVTARRALAEAYLAGGDKTAARATYEQILEHDPQDAPSINNLAFLKEQAGDADALDYAQRAYKLAPTDPDINDTLGWILVRHGRAEEGLRYLRDAQSRAADSAPIRYHIALALVALGRVDEARKELDDALASGQPFSGVDDAKSLRAKLAK